MVCNSNSLEWPTNSLFQGSPESRSDCSWRNFRGAFFGYTFATRWWSNCSGCHRIDRRAWGRCVKCGGSADQRLQVWGFQFCCENLAINSWSHSRYSGVWRQKGSCIKDHKNSDFLSKWTFMFLVDEGSGRESALPPQADIKVGYVRFRSDCVRFTPESRHSWRKNG